ncbi:hypothetical protein PMAYCL1PPCAC_14167, partial [Pristionchus mayeri]
RYAPHFDRYDMNIRLTGYFRRAQALFSDYAVAKPSRIDSPSDPFDLPDVPRKPNRNMTFCPENTLFVFRAKEVYRNAQEKEELRKKVQAGYVKRDEISTFFRVKFDEYDYYVDVPLAEDANFAEAASKMSSTATTMLARRIAGAEKRPRNNKNNKRNFDAVLEPTTSITVTSPWDGTRSLKQTLLDDDMISVEILENGKRKKQIPYIVRWLQYPLQSAAIPFVPREGFPLAATVELKNGATGVLFADAHLEAPSYPHVIRYCWFTVEKGGPGKDVIEWVNTDGSCWRPDIKGARFVCESPSFTPSAEHVGKYIAVAATSLPASRLSSSPSFPLQAWTVAGRSADVVVAKSIGEELLAAPKIEWAARDEQSRTEEEDKSRLRLVSYNLLADSYLNLKLSADELWYPYVDKKYQHLRYRYPLIFKELEGYAADIYFLQEVCSRMATHFLPALFKELNYGYSFHRKFMEVREGSGIVWNQKRFEQTGNWVRWLSDVLKEGENEDIRTLLSRSTLEEQAFFEDRPTLVHIVQLRDRVTGDVLIVGNTHLLHDPRHEHYKALQTALVAREVARRTREACAACAQTSNVRVLFGADLNSDPDSAAVALLTRGRIDASDAVWNADAAMGGMELRLPEELRRLVNISGEPEFTNYTKHVGKKEADCGFLGCIDYIFACGVEPIEVAEQPTVEEIQRHTALPSHIAPSDHLAIVMSARYSN